MSNQMCQDFCIYKDTTKHHITENKCQLEFQKAFLKKHSTKRCYKKIIIRENVL